MKLTLGFSTCPNDTYIFDAIIHNKVDTGNLEFEVIMADVEELNRRIMDGVIDISKLSYHAYAYAADKYRLLTSGSALGRKNGPLLISKRKVYPDEIKYLKIAIPGKYTTANLLFSIEFPDAAQKKEYLFSDIEEAILEEEADAGVIIHENRFTYQNKGLKKVMDLGENWEVKTGYPIPLGGIAVNRKIEKSIQEKINKVLKESIKFALKNPESPYSFVKENARELEDEVLEKHINLYVNDFTVDLGDAGKEAIQVLYKVAAEKKIIKNIPDDIFVI
ncbi:MAG: 1,4-dihydroxy-6-naphthoate synthase [Prolixibacteraceae bacterium]|nr:1,4-dihydroxy-6-naphthoate synthase [Prolixibacteraceae bacterium]